jgi:superfamily II DNA or RNA helicase
MFTIQKSTLRVDGTPGRPAPYRYENALAQLPPRFVTPSDQRIARHLKLSGQASWSAEDSFGFSASHGAELLHDLLVTGRCHWDSPSNPPLRLAPSRKGTPFWHRTPSGHLRASVRIEPEPTLTLPLAPPWYLDVERGECGPISVPLPDAVAAAWLGSPLIPPDAVELAQNRLRETMGTVELPEAPQPPTRTLLHVPPVATLHIASTRLHWWDSPRGFSETGPEGIVILVATLRFRYDTLLIDPDDTSLGTELSHYNGTELRIIPRDPGAETARLGELITHGLIRGREILKSNSLRPPLDKGWVLQDPDDQATADFLHQTIPTLASAGWEITRDPAFELEILRPDAWFLDTAAEDSEGGSNWFDLELGVLVGEERINLLPVLLEALQKTPGHLDPARLRKLKTNDNVLVQLPDGRRLPFPAGRLRDILATLIELHSPRALDASGRLRIHRLRAAELGDLAGAPNWNWQAPDDLRNLATRLNAAGAAQGIPAPAGLQATLRPYQQDGLRWLQFIREAGLGGVLADDMGLGKTVQTIAHLLVEKEHGRLDRPCLIVSPTSVLGNWADELARFAPSLRVVALHGTERHALFADITGADVILTTYALLHRDAKVFAETPFHALILDEAQNIKNPRTQAAQTACTLQARHRLCLSGTPLENHLGELWSLFNFLVPGYLADETRFRALFRTPIEKNGDTARRKHLAQRVRPLLLRRRKDEVALDLPPKTEIIQRIELGPAQRDLYETIRLAMESRVQAEIASKGLDRSHIVILDALLKLRQVCCDPALVPLEAARSVTESAKLEFLMEMLPTLLEDGRRILLFSQFTSMLDRIQTRLDKAGIPWLLLTGETTDRRTPVQRFQAGEVPLFLISLKAGGTGLNLTAADTVILFDPWWNPAVESQATDRAHRIGQDKPVFVYRLLTQGTVEEKIHQLQEKKRGLVEALLDEGAAKSVRLGREDLDALFAPIA